METGPDHLNAPVIVLGMEGSGPHHKRTDTVDVISCHLRRKCLDFLAWWFA